MLSRQLPHARSLARHAIGLIAGLALGVFAPAAAAAAPGWLPSSDVSAPAVWGEEPDVATDPAGDTVAVWRRFDDPAYTIVTSIRPAGGTFTQPVAIPLPGFADDPHVASDQDANAIAVWHYLAGSQHVVQAAVRPAHGPFGTPITLSGAGQHLFPRLAMNRAGDAVVAWQLNQGDRLVQVSTRPRGGTFSAAQSLTTDGIAADIRPQIDPAGNVVVVWDRAHGGARTVQASARPAGGSFSTPVDVSPAGPDAFAAHIAMDQGGNALVVWEQTGPPNTIHAALRLAGGSFSAPIPLSDATQSAVQPRVAMSPGGEAVAAWDRSNGSNRIVQAALKPPGGLFAAPVDVSAPGADAIDPQVDIDAAGDVVLAWTRSNGSNDLVQAAIRPAGGSFGAPVSLSAPGQDAADPQVATDEHGNAVALWRRFNGVRYIIQAAGYSRSAPQLSAIEVPATAPVATPVTFSVSPLAIWSSVASTDWGFGDGGAASGSNVTHTFATPGSYEVAVTATSVVGDTSSARRTILITPPPPPPPGPCTDCDNDGYPAAVDCKDADAAIHPGARDKPGNKVDEDCSGRDAPYPRLGSGVYYRYRLFPAYTRLTSLVVRPARAGSTIRIRCSGRGCRFKSKTRQVKKNVAMVSLTSIVRGSRLRPRARIVVRVTKPGTIGVQRTLTARAGKAPAETERCLVPGKTQPQRCTA